MIFLNHGQVTQLPDRPPLDFAQVTFVLEGCKLYKFAFCHVASVIAGQRQGPWEVLRRVCEEYQNNPNYSIWFDGARVQTAHEQPPQGLRLVLIAHKGFDPQTWRDMQVGHVSASGHS